MMCLGKLRRHFVALGPRFRGDERDVAGVAPSTTPGVFEESQRA
jgi:hypothetical protein